ncbi:PPE family protein, partial [Mycobacterium tuberculosis]
NFGIGNTGTGNFGIGNSGSTSTGLFNSGDGNTGGFNPGNFNTGNFNTGSFNTGGFNAGNTNTGHFNTGNYNTGIANTGDVSTGAFISGNYSNGILWRGDYQGLIGYSYALTIPEIPAHLDVNIPIDIPITGSFTDLVVDNFTIPIIGFESFAFSFHIHTEPDIGPIIVPSFVLSVPTFAIAVGGPTTAINISATAGLGPITIPIIDIPAAPGIGNSTTSPSSGFFNTGAGTASGFGNVGGNTSGLWNLASAASG